MHSIAGCASKAQPSPSPTPSAAAPPPLYSMADDIFTIDRDASTKYDFQANRNGSARAKYELRYDRDLWNHCAQAQIRLPVVTRYPSIGSPYSGFGNAEVGYSYNVTSATFNHSLEFRASLPTQSNGVDGTDTVLKALYVTQWKWSGGGLAYINEYDQTVIRPPGARETSYYEGRLSLPNVRLGDSPAWRGLKVSALYDYRVLFNDGGRYKSAMGAVMTGAINDVALNVVDTWGLGVDGLWKYRVEATAVARF